jgi:hypothetical protein
MSENTTLHEDFTRDDETLVGSERAFGVVMAVVFAIIGLFPLWGDGAVRLWALLIVAAFLFFAVFWPVALKPLNIAWFRFGLLLHKVVNPLVMGLVFFTTLVPTALIMRLLGKDILKMRPDPSLKSYWIERSDGGPKGETMRNQF